MLFQLFTYLRSKSNFPLEYEIPFLCILHPMYFGVHYVFRQGTTFLQIIKAIEIRPWAFAFINALKRAGTWTPMFSPRTVSLFPQCTSLMHYLLHRDLKEVAPIKWRGRRWSANSSLAHVAKYIWSWLLDAVSIPKMKNYSKFFF